MSSLISSGFNPLQEQQPLSNGEKYILQNLRNKKLLFLLGAYIGLLGVLRQVIYNLWTESDGELKLIWFINSPLVLLTFLFLILTIFFLKYYFDVVHPFTKDIRSRKKDIIRFIAEKYKTPYFEEFFLKTPLKKRSLVKINKELYEAIQDNNTACISISSYARFVFNIEVGGQKLELNEKNFIIE